MKILIAPDSFKGSLSANEVCEVMKETWLSHFPNDVVMTLPVADGGEGTVDALQYTLSGVSHVCTVKDPLGRNIQSSYMVHGDLAVMEMASASGIMLLQQDELNPLYTNTFGTGQMVLSALDQGVKKIVIGIGGSATNDCGLGMLEALGAVFYHADKRISLRGAIDLKQIDRIDLTHLDQRLKNTVFEVMCDVNNPLTGPHGATYVYGPQKGLVQSALKDLDEDMKRMGQLMDKIAGRDISLFPGSGAAGGLGAAFLSVLNGVLKPGIEAVLDVLQFDDFLEDVDLVLTGEGCLDAQTQNGKVPMGVLKRCQVKGIPVIAVGGSLQNAAMSLYDVGFGALMSTVTSPMPLEQAIADAGIHLQNCVTHICQWIKLAGQLAFKENYK